MFRSLAMIPVGEKESETRGGAPLGFGRGDVLIDLGLGAVGEIAELGLPEDKHLRAVERVAVVEAKNGGLG